MGPKCDRNCAAHSKKSPFCTFVQHRPKDGSIEKRASISVKSSFKLSGLNENLNGWTLLGKNSVISNLMDILSVVPYYTGAIMFLNSHKIYRQVRLWGELNTPSAVTKTRLMKKIFTYFMKR